MGFDLGCLVVGLWVGWVGWVLGWKGLVGLVGFWIGLVGWKRTAI